MKQLLGVIVAAALVLPGCKPSSGSSSSGSGGTYRVTLHYLFTTASTNAGSVAMPIMSGTDLSLFQTQSGATQTAGNGFIYGVVRDSGNLPIALAQVQAVNETGTSIGTIIYRTGTGFNGLTSTNSTGQFVVFNVSPGRINLRATAGASGNLHVRVEADGCTSVNLIAQPAAAQVMVSGVTQSYANVGGSTPLAATTVGAVGIGAPFSVISDGTGNYTTGATNIDANSTLLLRLTNGVTEVTCYNYVKTLTSNLAQNLFIATIVERAGTDFTPATVVLDPLKGIIRGKVNGAGGNDGYQVVATNNAGAIVGIAAYGDSLVSNTPGAGTTTDTSGIFYIYNVDAGPILLRAVKAGFAGSLQVEVYADAITFLYDAQLQATAATNPTVTITGVLFDLTSGAIGTGNISLRGTTVSANSDPFGVYGLTSVPSNSGMVVRTSK